MKNKATLDVLYKLKKEIVRSDNDDLISQIDHALDKTYRDQLSFSFIGHFSAGKSSLINYLLGNEILPASPVPTTSKTVSVEISAVEEIKAYINQYQYVKLADYEELRTINAQDVDIQSIVLRMPHAQFKTDTVIQDTPGVDSRTKAHSESTERFLLNSDYIFFTVEYNHVESEHNLALLKELSDLNIPLSLVINQVDKHNAMELSFETFLERVKHTLDTWGIAPEHIFTTTIYESEHNQIDALKNFMHDIEHKRDAWQQKYHDRIIQNIETKQIEFLSDMIETSLSEVDDTDTESLSLEDIDTKIAQLDKEQHENTISNLHADPAKFREHIKDQTKSIMTDAYLFPHTVKEPITDYLKFLAGEIKVSGLFGKKKKEEALESRLLGEIDSAFSDVLKAQVDSPINTMLMDHGLRGETFVYTWSNKLLGSQPITTLSNDYILNYFDGLKSCLSKDVVDSVLKLMSTLDTVSTEETRSSQDIADKIERYRRIKDLVKLRQSLTTTQYRHFHIHLEDEIEKLTFSEAVSYEIETSEEAAPEDVVPIETSEANHDKAFFERLVKTLEGNPRYHVYYQTMSDKLERMRQNKSNISVFGGFSAGKTTFINALLQTRMLATSPNPTTATITEVNDTTSEIIFKSSEDVIDMLKIITNQDKKSLDAYITWIKRHINEVRDVYKPFLRGLLEKYDDYKPLLGTTTTFSTDEIVTKIASDVDATFIHKAYVAVQNEFTRNFNIIDSPGINSINQRHTNETKNIITGSDLIVYVSYYNHVFNRADEAFLSYIKSLKGDNFPIVFVINAIDLMKSDAELRSVVKYMSDSLTRMNISGTILPVSSMQAITNYDDAFYRAKEAIIDLATEQTETNQLNSLELLYHQTLRHVESNIKLYENQEAELSRINNLRAESLTKLDALNLLNIEHTTDVEIDILLNHMHKQLELALYDELKGVLNTHALTDKKHITNNISSILAHITQFINVQVATSFNSIYRTADKEITSTLHAVNESLQESRTTHVLETHNVPWQDVGVEIDADTLLGYEKELYQARHNFKKFNDTLLTLSRALAKNISAEQLRLEMRTRINIYLEDYAALTTEDTKGLKQALAAPLETVSDEDYRKDQMLYNELKEFSHAT